MKRIMVDHGTRKTLIDEGHGSYHTIANALDFRCNTERAKRIRQRALQLGGVVMEVEKTTKTK